MTIREALFATYTGLALVFVVRGVYLIHVPVAWIVAGVLFGAWSWLVLGGDA